MSDYQAVYDAVRSQFHGGYGEIIREVATYAFDTSHSQRIIIDLVARMINEYERPSAVFRPKLSADGTKWCALLGDDIMSGLAAFGDTPEEAMRAFDEAWRNQLTPKAEWIAAGIKEEESREETAAHGQFGVGA